MNEKYACSEVSKPFLLLIPKAKNINVDNGRSSDLLPFMNAFPIDQWQKCCSKRFTGAHSSGYCSGI